MTGDELLDSLCADILLYEPGDVMHLSGMMDTLDAFSTGIPGDYEAAIRSAADIRNLLRAELKGRGSCDLRDTLPRALEGLRSLAAAKSHRPETESPGLPDGVYETFFADARDRFDQAESLVLALEGGAYSAEDMNTLFRIFHTVKGECGFLGYERLGELSHRVESLLEAVKSLGRHPGEDAIELLLEGLDRARTILAVLGAARTEGAKSGAESAGRNGEAFDDEGLGRYYRALEEWLSRSRPSLGVLLQEEGKLTKAEVEAVLDRQKETGYAKKFGQIAVEQHLVSQEELEACLNAQGESRGAAADATRWKSDPLVKVKASKINYLVDMVGELLITLGQISENSPTVMQLRKITRNLQLSSMELRTETVRSLFHNARRVSRDLSKQLGKPLRLEIRGESLEIDRNLIEKLEEPLLHLVRNAIDHGIESPELRKERGKDPEGTLRLAAERKGNTILLSVEDDGGGLDKERILAKAVDKGIVTETAAGSMSAAEAHALIFAPGFSTRDGVSKVSGRGVGMDIVRTAVADSRGRVEIETEPGSFTRFKLLFPLSTAIIEGMIARVGKTLFILPLASIAEIMKLDARMLASVQGGLEIASVRGEALPVLRPRALFAMEPGPVEAVAVAVENGEGRRFLLAVDEVIAKREVVIKSLGSRFRDMRGVSSCSIMAGGAIGLVLDIDQLVELSLADCRT